MYTNSVIQTTGAFIPKGRVKNKEFLSNTFLNRSGERIPKSAAEIIEKLHEITSIEERRYACGQSTRDMASGAAANALEHSTFDRESLGGIIVAHNFGDIQPDEHQGHMIPNLAAKVKHDLGIKNSKCFAFDVLFGCPGWLLAMDQAHHYIQSGAAASVLVIGVESLSRVLDPHNIDSMLFGDGAGAALVVAKEEHEKRGILAYQSVSDCGEELEYLKMDKPLQGEDPHLYISMTGRSVFKYAVNNVPLVITECLNSLSIKLEEVGQFLFHQANAKMIEAIGMQLAKLHEQTGLGSRVPIILQKLGNTSVATIPTLLDMMRSGELSDYPLKDGDIAVMASVGAGMHANCLVYKN